MKKFKIILIIILILACFILIYLHFTHPTIIKWDSIYEFAELKNNG